MVKRQAEVLQPDVNTREADVLRPDVDTLETHIHVWVPMCSRTKVQQPRCHPKSFVCVGGCVGVWVRGWVRVRACVRARVCPTAQQGQSTVLNRKTARTRACVGAYVCKFEHTPKDQKLIILLDQDVHLVWIVVP